MQEMEDLRRRLAAAEDAAEVRRRALLTEKAKAQNALGQLAITREKVWCQVVGVHLSSQCASCTCVASLV